MIVVSGLLLAPRWKGDLNSACDVEASVELASRFWMAVEVVRRAGTAWRVAPRTSEVAAREEIDMSADVRGACGGWIGLNGSWWSQEA